MLTTKEVRGVKVCRPFKPGQELNRKGLPRHRRKIGKVYKTVFSPDGLRVVGFIVRRPDLLLMFKRPERFLALDAVDVQDGFIVPSKGSGSWDDAAVKRLDIDWDTCILWEGIDVRTRDGHELGHVDEISFDEQTGDMNSLFLDDGGAARALVGSVEIPAELVVGYRKGVMIVENEAARLMPTGGLAAKAGEATAKAGQKTKQGMAKADDAMSNAVDKGTTGLGRAIGGLKRGMSSAVENYREESGAAEREAQKKAAEQASARKSAAAKAAPAAKKAASGAKASSASSAKRSSSSAAKPSSSSAASKAGSGTASKGSAKAKPASSKASSSKKQSDDDVRSIGEAFGDQMKAAGSMFSDFKKEFDKAKK